MAYLVEPEVACRVSDGERMLRRTLFTLLLSAGLCGALVASGAQERDVTGVAFIDANKNGVRDYGEPGLAHVVVSNPDAVVATDASGAYRLPRGANRLMFVSVPDGYRTVGPFWRAVDSGTSAIDVPLAPIPRATRFTFVHASDLHIAPAVV